jgi:hypothetical protein
MAAAFRGLLTYGDLLPSSVEVKTEPGCVLMKDTPWLPECDSGSAKELES